MGGMHLSEAMRWSGAGAGTGAAIGLIFGLLLDQMILAVVVGLIVGGLGTALVHSRSARPG
jgi:uncharacterized membrane protein